MPNELLLGRYFLEHDFAEVGIVSPSHLVEPQSARFQIKFVDDRFHPWHTNGKAIQDQSKRARPFHGAHRTLGQVNTQVNYSLFCFILIRTSSSLSKLGAQNALNSASQSTAAAIFSAFNLAGRRCLSISRSINPARSSTFRCLETAGWLISNGAAISFTDAGPSASRDSIDRRVASANAAKTSSRFNSVCI